MKATGVVRWIDACGIIILKPREADKTAGFRLILSENTYENSAS